MMPIPAAFLPVAMMVLMLTLGLRLRLADLAAVVARPRALLTGLAVQVVGLPVLALGLIAGLGLTGTLAAGLVLLAASPGGVSSNYIAHLARGSVALSVTMTALTSLLAPLSLPLVLAATGLARLAPVDLLRVSLGMSAVAVLPLALGMMLTARAPRLAARAEARLAPLAKALFVAMVLATFWQNRAAMADLAGRASAAILALALAAPGLALAAGRVMRLTPPEARTIAIEASLQNVAVTMFVAGALLHDPALAVPALVYAVGMNVVAVGMIAASGRVAAST